MAYPFAAILCGVVAFLWRGGMGRPGFWAFFRMEKEWRPPRGTKRAVFVLRRGLEAVWGNK